MIKRIVFAYVNGAEFFQTAQEIRLILSKKDEWKHYSECKER
jgi:hypothetical protein